MNSFASNHKADSLFQTGDYFHASIEYERLVYYSTNRVESNNFVYKKTLCYKKLGDYQKALDELQTIYFSSETDSLYSYVTYEQVVCSYLNNEPLKALWKIDEFINRTHDTLTYINFIPIKILCHNELQEWENAQTELLYLLNYNLDNEALKNQYFLKVDSLYTKKGIPNFVKL